MPDTIRLPYDEEVASLISRLDRESWQALQANFVLPQDEVARLRHQDRLERQQQNYAKYFVLERWFRYHLRHVRNLDLDTSSPKRILDVGCGFGLFAHLCGHYGHDAMGLDLDIPLYRAAADLLGVEYTVGQVTGLKRLPTGLRGFDVISAIAVKFDQPEYLTAEHPYWTAETWSFWLGDMADRLNEGGLIYLKLHPVLEGNLPAAEINNLNALWQSIASWQSDTNDLIIPVENVLKIMK